MWFNIGRDLQPTTHCFNINKALSQTQKSVVLKLIPETFYEQLSELPLTLRLVLVAVDIDVKVGCLSAAHCLVG